jgi:DNA-binding MarR family transcriptional regulator
MEKMSGRISDDGYQRLLRFRNGLRRFERWSEQQAEAAGLTSAQHQLLLAIRGHPGRQEPTISDLAEHLLLRHHSVVELVDRAASAGLVERHSDPADRRLARIHLTPRGAAILRRLTHTHLDELARLAPAFEGLWDGLVPTKHLPPERRVGAD